MRRPIGTRAQPSWRPRPRFEPGFEPISVAKIASSLRELETILASLPAGMAIHDERGVVHRGDLSACHRSGLGKSEKMALARLYAEALPPWVERVLQTGEPVHGLELSVEYGGQTRFWVCNLAPIRSPRGSVTGVTSAVHDITSIKLGEAPPQEAYREPSLPPPAESVLESHIEQLRGENPGAERAPGPDVRSSRTGSH